MVANEEAERLQHNYIGTEHLLVGLVVVDEGLASMVLGELGADIKRVRESVERMAGMGRRASPGSLDLTPRTKQVLEYQWKKHANLDTITSARSISYSA